MSICRLKYFHSILIRGYNLNSAMEEENGVINGHSHVIYSMNLVKKDPTVD